MTMTMTITERNTAMAEEYFDVNLSGYTDERAGRVVPGDYLVSVLDVKKGESREAKNPMVMLGFRVEEGEFVGTRIADTLVLTDRALWRVVSFLDALAIETPKKNLRIPFNRLIGRRLVVTVADDEWNNRIRSKVSDYMRAATAKSESTGGAPETPADLEGPTEVAAEPEAAQNEPVGALSVVKSGPEVTAIGASFDINDL